MPRIEERTWVKATSTASRLQFEFLVNYAKISTPAHRRSQVFWSILRSHDPLPSVFEPFVPCCVFICSWLRRRFFKFRRWWHYHADSYREVHQPHFRYGRNWRHTAHGERNQFRI